MPYLTVKLPTALVVNCSSVYNLGYLKLSDWLRSIGYKVTQWVANDNYKLLDKFYVKHDLVCVCCVFSWDAVIALHIALAVSGKSEVWCGGPGMFALRKWWKRETGLECTPGPDVRFEGMSGDYKMTFASRGCPVGCWFCIVPKMEGLEFTLNWDFSPALSLMDNNLSALPIDFQDHVIRRYQESGIELRDASSGFEPKVFDSDTYRRWKPILKGPWRFALDEVKELDEVHEMATILKDVCSSRKRVYVLIGNEPIQQCYERVSKVIEWGCEPHCQPVLPLNALDRNNYIIRYDWSHQRLTDFARFYNRWLWRKLHITEYKPRVDGVSTFAGVL